MWNYSYCWSIRAKRSGTGNMKFAWMINDKIWTLNETKVGIIDEVGEENTFILVKTEMN